jgi:hypothetical protein
MYFEARGFDLGWLTIVRHRQQFSQLDTHSRCSVSTFIFGSWLIRGQSYQLTFF